MKDAHYDIVAEILAILKAAGVTERLAHELCGNLTWSTSELVRVLAGLRPARTRRS